MVDARVERRLAAILAADVAGYSRLMGTDEEGTLAALKACRRELIDPKIAEHRGRLVKTTGDGALVEFASAVDATRCAVEIQRAMVERNATIPEDRRVDANNARARFAEALLYRLLRKPAESVRANEIAVALDRNFAVARNVLSSALLDLGQPEKAIPQTEQAMRLDPLGPQINTMQFNMGKAHFLLQHIDEAIDWFLKSRASNPNFPRTLAWIAALYAQKGEENSARQVVADLLRIAPHFKLSLSIDAPSTFSPKAYREWCDRSFLPSARSVGVPE
jgi:tetratricopeptide (TPR) repeat protein